MLERSLVVKPFGYGDFLNAISFISFSTSSIYVGCIRLIFFFVDKNIGIDLVIIFIFAS
jgi:hypothetical protein